MPTAKMSMSSLLSIIVAFYLIIFLPIDPFFALHVPHITALVFSTGSPPSVAEMEEESSISLRQVN